MLPSSGTGTSPVSAGAFMSRSWTRTEGRPSGTVTIRWRVFALCRRDNIWAWLARAGISYSPALIDSPPPNNLAWSRKRSAEAIAPAFSSWLAAATMLVPGAITTEVGWRDGPAPLQPWMNQSPKASPATRTRRSATSFFMMRSDGPHHQAGIGPAEAEAVVQHRLDLPLLGDVGDEVDSRRALARIVEVEGRRNDLVAHGEDAEDRLDRPGAAQE